MGGGMAMGGGLFGGVAMGGGMQAMGSGMAGGTFGGGMGGGMGGMGGGGMAAGTPAASGAPGAASPPDGLVTKDDRGAATEPAAPPPLIDELSADKESADEDNDQAEPAPAEPMTGRLSLTVSQRQRVHSTPRPAVPSAEYDSDTLVDMITTTVAPKSWEQNGGQGSIAFFEPSFELRHESDG